MIRLFARSLCLAAVVAATFAAAPNGPYAPDTPEAGSVEAIAKFTTEARFGNPWVAYVPASATVPSPTKYLGHVAGAAGELSRTAQIYGYFRELAKSTPRVKVDVIGKSEEGREILLAAIADEEGIRDLDRLKAATAALADPRTTTPEQAEKIIATARPIYYFNAGLHSAETGSPEMVMELAYRLAVSNQPMIEQIRRNVIVLINPVSEPYCGSCNRMRLTADGRFHLCLLKDDELDVRAALRRGAERDEIAAILLRAVAAKPTGHELHAGVSTMERSMHHLGG